MVQQLEEGGSGSDLCAFLRMSRSVASQSLHNSSTTSLQYLALQEELSDVKERNVQLAARLQQREAELNEARRDLEAVGKEKETLREKVTQLEEKLVMAPALSPVKRSSSTTESKVKKDQNFWRLAEKKKIKKITQDDPDDPDTDDDGNFAAKHGPVTGSELLSVGVRNSVVVEHLVQDLQDRSSMQEFQHSMQHDPVLSANLGQHHKKAGAKSDIKRRSAVLETKLQEFEIEMERLSSRIEHLKSQNEVLTLTLTESKNHCDNLTVLIGKYESNHTAQQLVIAYLDHMIEILQALSTLRENDHDGKCRKVAENKAKSLLKSLDGFTRPDSGLALPSSAENASWDDSSGYSQNSSLGSNQSGLVSSSIGSFTFTANNCHDPCPAVAGNEVEISEETKLKDLLSQLNSARVSVQATLLTELESHHPEHDIKPNVSKTADLEVAVLVQELMAMREDKADLRAQVHLLEKEKKSLDLIISSQQAQEQALKTHIRHLQEELENQDSMVKVNQFLH